MLDYMVMEAVALKVNKQDADERAAAERKAAVEAERKRLVEAVK